VGQGQRTNREVTTRRLPPAVPAVVVLVVAAVAAIVVWLVAGSDDSPQAGRSTTTLPVGATSPEEASRPYGAPGAGAKSDPKAAAAARNPPGGSAVPATAPTTVGPLPESTLNGSGPASLGPFTYVGPVRVSFEARCPATLIIGTGANRTTVASGDTDDVQFSGSTPIIVASNCPWTLHTGTPQHDA
jgi:hypothetical protein